MKILILIGNLVAGGIERQGIHDANAFLELGHDVTLGFLKDGRYRTLVSPNVKLIDFGMSSYFTIFMKLAVFCKKQHFTVILSHHVVLNLLSSIVSKLCRSKCIVNEHGLSLNSKFRHIFMRKITYVFCDEVIAASNATLSVRHERENLSPERGVVVYNSYRFTTDSAIQHISLRDQFRLPYDAVLFGTVTRMHPIKRVDLFIDLAFNILKDHNDAYFFILGDGQLMQSLQNYAFSLNICDRVYFLGYMSNVPAYLSQFDVFALTSEIEANSLALLEALSMKLPCLAFDVGGNSEIITSGFNGYLANFPDVITMSTYASSLISSPFLRSKLAHNAYTDAFNRFSPEVRNKLLNDILVRVCSARRQKCLK